MTKKEFKAESKRVLDLMINSIYTNKEIFLRELISNASDAIDKIYYIALTDDNIDFNKEDYFIKVDIDKENREIEVWDKGIGMTQEELEDNLGIIARSGSLLFKEENIKKDNIDIIGQFGVGFYSAFMVADKVTVITKALNSDTAYKWEAEDTEGYTIEEIEKEEIGTRIILKLKENTEEEDYDQFLEEDRIRSIIKKYSDFIRYPIKMDITEMKAIEDKDDEYEEVVMEKVINTRVPIWKKNKNELTEEDYDNFYAEKHFGFDKPLKSIHLSVDGLMKYDSILFIPKEVPYDLYSKEYEKGLELYSSGVLIMEKSPELLPDYFSFVKGIVDSEDLSLNISREMLQHDRQLNLMAKRIRDKIKEELLSLMENDRENYEEFFKSFGRQLKFGIYDDFGANKDVLKDLILFYSSKREKLISLKEYIEEMKDDQENIYYASGESIDRIDKLPQVEFVKDKGLEIIYLTEDVDEFAVKVLQDYDEKQFKSVSSSDLDLDKEEKEEESEKIEENKDLFSKMEEYLAGKVKNVRGTSKLKSHPVYLASEGELSIEMEKVLSQMPNVEGMKADKVLEINMNHKVFESLKSAYEKDEEELELYTNLLYNQARLIEGLPLEDPVEFTNNIWKLL